MGLLDEYATIKEAMRSGTLRAQPPEQPMHTWVENRFTHKNADGYTSFGEHFVSREPSTIAYSFGRCTLKDSLKVSIPNDMSNGRSSISPGPQVAC